MDQQNLSAPTSAPINQPERRLVAAGHIRRSADGTTRIGITGRITPATLRLRTRARAVGYNPDQPTALDALACIAGTDTAQLHAAFTGRAALDQLPPQRTLISFERRDVRTAIGSFRRW